MLPGNTGSAKDNRFGMRQISDFLDCSMETHATLTIEISDRDLEPLSPGQSYARLKPRAIQCLAPIRNENGTFHLAVLRVKEGTPPFQLPAECVLLAIEGKATVAVPGQGCAIWFCENLDLEAGIAVLGAGHFRKLNCEAVSLLPVEELQGFLPNVSSHRVAIQQGRVDYVFLAHSDPESLTHPLRRIGAEIEGLGTMQALRIGTLDSAVVTQGKMQVEKEVYLEEWLREEIHDLLWENAADERRQRIEVLLGWPDHCSALQQCYRVCPGSASRTPPPR
jgi:hypothetical protein